MTSTAPIKYECVPGPHGLFSVIDVRSGMPANVGATAILLTQKEARKLIKNLRLSHKAIHPPSSLKRHIKPSVIGTDKPAASDGKRRHILEPLTYPSATAAGLHHLGRKDDERLQSS